MPFAFIMTYQQAQRATLVKSEICLKERMKITRHVTSNAIPNLDLCHCIHRLRTTHIKAKRNNAVIFSGTTSHKQKQETAWNVCLEFGRGGSRAFR